MALSSLITAFLPQKVLYITCQNHKLFNIFPCFSGNLFIFAEVMVVDVSPHNLTRQLIFKHGSALCGLLLTDVNIRI